MWETALLVLGLITLVAVTDLNALKGYRLIWQIGELDESPGEFALAPDGARRFVTEFPQDPVYVVGTNRPEDWPFIHPNEADTAWGGSPHHTFRIRFHLPSRPTGRWALLIALADVHERLAPQMIVSVNGHEHRQRLHPGAGRAYYGDFRHLASQSVWVQVDASELRSGENEIAISLTSGSWVAYDAIALLRRSTTATAGRRPKARPHAFTDNVCPLHSDFSTLRGWQSSLIALDGQAGWLALVGTRKGTAIPPATFPCDYFVVELDVRVVQGKMGLRFCVPDAIQPYWSIVWGEDGVELIGSGRGCISPSPGTWRLRVNSAPDGAELFVRRLGDKRWTSAGKIGYTPGPPGRLEFFVASALAHCYVTNLAWTLPLKLSAVCKAQRNSGRNVHVSASVPTVHGDATATLTLLDADGAELGRRVISWSGSAAAVSASLAVPGNGKPDHVVCQLRQPGRRGPIWTVSTPVVRDTSEKIVMADRPSEPYAVATETGWIVGNAAFEIAISKTLGPTSLVDRRGGFVLADQPYSYAPLGEEVPHVVEAVSIERQDSGALKVALRIHTSPANIVHRLVFPADLPSFAETFEVKVPGTANEPVDLSGLRCGWVRTVAERGRLLPPLGSTVLIPVPWRRDTWGGDELLDLTIPEAIWKSGWYRDSGSPARVRVPQHGSEGWLWQRSNSGTLIVKLNEEFMEWSLVDRVCRDGAMFLRFGGCGAWHGDPQSWSSIPPTSTVHTGWTHYIAYSGDWKEGFYTFRHFMERHGHGCPPEFDPPVHWNELYDNPLWWGPDTPERRKKYYRLQDMVVEAEKAQAAGCQSLYLDPGWDTVFGSHIWDEARLGPVADFVELMRDRYGLKVSLHTPLADWASGGGGGRTYPADAWRVDQNGHVIEGSFCSGATAYLEEEARRLIALADAGVCYFMFDGSRYTGPCFSIDHGHPVPYTRDDHVRALRRLAQMVHAQHPEVIIEQHDQIVAGVHSVYVPVYLGHDDGGWDERWANEYMWRPLEDVRSGRALSLYYYNMAYSLPQYIHIDLRDDNEHCLALWWYASTCRHLGIGGTHPDGRNWLRVQRHMRQYLRLQDFFKRGTFYGLEEEVHLHVLPAKGAVVNVFNLSDRPVVKKFTLDLARVGFQRHKRLRVRGAQHVRDGNKLYLQTELPAWGATLVEIATGR